MKVKWIPLFGLVLLAAHVCAEEPRTLTTPRDKVSYGIGVDVARNFQRLGVNLDLDLMIKALRDVYGGGTLLMSEEELRTTMDARFHLRHGSRGKYRRRWPHGGGANRQRHDNRCIPGLRYSPFRSKT